MSDVPDVHTLHFAQHVQRSLGDLRSIARVRHLAH